MTDTNFHLNSQVEADFDKARFRAFVSDLGSFITRRDNVLFSFDEVSEKLNLREQSYRGLTTVPVLNIIGSVDRYHDFNAHFLPAQNFTKSRWKSIDRAYRQSIDLPSISLYKVGDIYFVKDGNHRVSVARQMGVEFIDAEVIECHTRVPVGSDLTPQRLLELAEYGRFLELTHLDKLRPGHNILFTTLGRYDTLLEHINVHHYFLGLAEPERDVTREEAVLSWYDTLYQPVFELIEREHILSAFPHHTHGDLYLWIMDHRWFLSEDRGTDVSSAEALLDFETNYRKQNRLLRRLNKGAISRARSVFVISSKLLSRASHALFFDNFLKNQPLDLQLSELSELSGDNSEATEPPKLPSSPNKSPHLPLDPSYSTIKSLQDEKK